VPAAVAGAGLATYTASLLSATSTPLWAAAPRSLAVRFGASSVAAGAASLSLVEHSGKTRRKLDSIAVAALATELAATLVSHETYRRTGVAEAVEGRWGQVDKIGVTGLGTGLPLGLQLASLALGRRRPGILSDIASVAVLAGSLLLRVSMLSNGDTSAARPDISFRFSQPDNLP
jgi:protein NrfD